MIQSPLEKETRAKEHSIVQQRHFWWELAKSRTCISNLSRIEAKQKCTMVKKSKKDSDVSHEEVEDVKNENGGTDLKSGLKNSKHQRSNTLDNAFLVEGAVSLDHSEVEERRSLPSLDKIEDEIPVEEGLPAELLEVLANPSIEDDSPAAEALRANAEIRVRKVGKLARRVHGQSVRRAVKRATLRSKSGRVRGKPPRIPPAKVPSGSIVAGPDNEIYVVQEGDDEEELEEDEMDSSLESSEEDAEYKHDHDDEAALYVAAASGDRHSEGDVIITDEVVKEGVVVDKVPDWQTRLTEQEGDHSVPAEVLTATMETGKKGEYFPVRYCFRRTICAHAFL